MNEKINYTNSLDVTPGYTSYPDRLLEALQLADDWEVFHQDSDDPVSDVFLARCDRAADSALAQIKLRRACQRAGFSPLPLNDYLAGLAQAAQTPLAPLLDNFGVTSLTAIDAASVPGIVRLAQMLGLSLRETLAYLRIELARQLGVAPALLTARRRSTGNLQRPLEECEAALMRIEQETDEQTQVQMRRLVAEITRAWQRSEATPEPAKGDQILLPSDPDAEGGQ